MARLWSGGAELQTATAGIEFSAIITSAPAIETTIKRAGGNAAWRISNAAAIEGFRVIHTSAQGDFRYRFYLYIVAAPSATKVIGGARTTGANKVSIRLTTGRALQLYNSEDLAQIGSDSSALSLNTWYRVEIKYDSTTLAATAVEAFAYPDTAGASSFWTASGTIDITATPTSFGNFIEAADATLDYVVDDCAINDTTTSFQNGYPGEAGGIFAQRPSGAGDNAQWARGGTDTGANWSQTSEVPPDSAQYVESNTANQIDDYEMGNTPSAMGASDTVNVVHVGGYVAVSDATGNDPDIVFRIKSVSGGTVEESASLDVNSVTYQGPAPLPFATGNYALTLYDLPGASTSVWTKALLDTAQAGVREAVTDTHFARVAALWMMVEWKPATASTSIIHPILSDDTIQGVTFGGQVVQ